MKPSLSSQGRDLLAKAMALWHPLEMATCNDGDTHRNPRPCPLGLSAGPTHPWKWAGVCLTPPKAAYPCVHLSFGCLYFGNPHSFPGSLMGWTQPSLPAKTRSWGCSVLQSDPQCLTRALWNPQQPNPNSSQEIPCALPGAPSSPEPRHPRAHQAPSTPLQTAQHTWGTPVCSHLLLVTHGENGVWLLPHCPHTSPLEEALGSGYMSHTQWSHFGHCMCLLLF